MDSSRVWEAMEREEVANRVEDRATYKTQKMIEMGREIVVENERRYVGGTRGEWVRYFNHFGNVETIIHSA